MSRIAVVGAGITGLACAYELTRGEHPPDVVVFEAADRPGGKLRASPFAGQLVEEGADAFLARVPWALELCDQLGLTPELTEPAERSAFVWSRGAMRRLPTAQLLGVPTDLDELATTGIVSAAGIEAARADLDRRGPGPDGDPAIGPFLRGRLGDEVTDRLVAPLVGGINAGDIDRLSLRAVAAQIAAAADRGGSLVRSAAAIRASASTDPAAPVFHAPVEGMSVLIDRLVAALDGLAEVRTGTSVRDLAPLHEEFDRIVLTTPAHVSAGLVAASPAAARFLRGIDHASVVMVTLALDRAAVSHPLDGSGVLVPAVEGRTVTACSFSSSKWAHVGDDDTVVLRVSIGRDGDPARATDRSDDELVADAVADLDDLLGLRDPPTEHRVTRWIDSLPQYRPGHLDALVEAEAALADDLPDVVVTGAACRGLGVPACIQQGRLAARALLG